MIEPKRGHTLMRAFVCALVLSGCAKAKTLKGPAAPLPAAKLIFQGSGIVNSSVVGNGAASNKGGVVVKNVSYSVSGAKLVQFNQAWSAPKLVTVPLGHFSASDFGVNGSITLTANAQNYPISGGAYPVLAKFTVVPDAGGAAIEYVNTTAGCYSTGMWTCSGNNCNAQVTCTVSTPSSFANRNDWDQHQLAPFGYTSANTFPRCDSTVNSWSGCPANQNALPSGTYSATYVLMSDSGDSVDALSAGLKVDVTIRQDSAARNPASGKNGAINLNVILVGDQNVDDSHSAKGANNLNLLLRELNRLYSTVTNAKIGIDQVQIYEWTDANGGSQYSQVDVNNLGDLFESGSKGVASSDEGKFINVFLVSNIECSSCGGFSILGLSGAILGPPTNGTQTSGLAFGTFDSLATFNPACGDVDVNCDRNKLENDFLEMGATIAHELGHYLGLNHPSEKPASDHSQQVDQLSDTPTCGYRSIASGTTMDQHSCFLSDGFGVTQPSPLAGTSCEAACNAVTGATPYLSATANPASRIDPWSTSANTDMPRAFCGQVPECQFNHVMWYTTKNRKLLDATGNTCSISNGNAGLCTWAEDGNLISPQSSAIVQWDPFLR